ncbi:MAG: ABC transporter substrate-binding protein, partial [Actinomycetota bacterium]
GEAMALVHDTLVTTRRAAGPAFDLVPDLARRLPTPTDGGLTWTFEVRTNVRYSDGRLLQPEDFRRGMERLYSPRGVARGAFALHDFDAITGTVACRATMVCRLDTGITTSSSTVSYHLSRPDPDFLHKLTMSFAAPAPAGMGPPEGTQKVPGTGPYRVRSFTPDGVTHAGSLVLERNPYFRQWSVAAKPQGYADVIEWTGGPTRGGVVRLDQLTADVTDVRGATVLPLLATRFPDRLQHDPQLGTHWAALNTRSWPFSRREARQAVAYALDRAAIARFFGDTRTACQLPPPNFPGHLARCDYTRDPRPGNDQWRGPDLARARAIVARSPTRGAVVEVYLPAQDGGPALGRTLVRTLAAIGYVGRLHLVPEKDGYFKTTMDPGTPVDLSVAGWSVDYLTPSQMYLPMLGCDHSTPGGTGQFNVSRRCDPSSDQLMVAATAAQNSDPAQARALERALTKRVNDDAALVPTDYWDRDTFVSTRVGNYQDNGLLGPLLEQIWVR